MPLHNPDDQRRHVAQGEADVADWKVWELAEQKALADAEAALSGNPSDQTLRKKRDEAARRHENVRQAREERESSLAAAKRCFGWTD